MHRPAFSDRRGTASRHPDYHPPRALRAPDPRGAGRRTQPGRRDPEAGRAPVSLLPAMAATASPDLERRLRATKPLATVAARF
jgi:hypothetical protein